MKINRNNYQEYFLLYIDNELTDEDRWAVEAFAATHPDLAEELELLADMKLSAEEIRFPDTANLLRFTTTEPEAINGRSLSYWIQLYIDNELTDAQEKALLGYIHTHPEAEKELGLWRAAKLNAKENYTYPYTASLYRNEEQQIGTAWWKWSIAAIAFLMLALTLFFQYSGNISTPSSVYSTASLQQPNPAERQVIRSMQKNESGITSANPAINSGVVPEKSAARISPANQTRATNLFAKKNLGNGNNLADVSRISRLPSEEIQSPANQAGNYAIATLSSDKTTLYLQEAAIAAPIAIENKLPQSLSGNRLAQPTASVSTPIVFTPDEEEKSSTGKRGWRGFFRKVGRTLARNTGIGDTERENRILVGSLAIAR